MNSQTLLVGAERFGFTLDPVELSVLRQAFGVRSRLFPLRLGSTTDPGRVATLTGSVDAALNRRGLFEDGRLNPAVAAGFELLAEHRTAVSITGAPGDLTALAVSNGVQAMAITQQHDEELRCALFPAAELVDMIVAALPPAPAAAGVPVVAGHTSFGDPAGADRTTEPRLGGGLLVASGQGRHGLWSDMLGWVDTARGRHLVGALTDGSGDFSARYSPAGPAELTAAVSRLLESDR